MKLSHLNARIEKLEKRLEELEQIKGMHFMKRPDEWKGTEATMKLSQELDATRAELKELRAWRRGHWYEDDIGAGGGWLRQLLLAA